MSETYEVIDPVERLNKLNKIITRLKDELAFHYSGIQELPDIAWMIYIAYKEYESLEKIIEKKCRDKKLTGSKCLELKLTEYKKLYGLDTTAMQKVLVDKDVLITIIKTFSPTAQLRTSMMYESVLGITPKTEVEIRGYLKGKPPRLEVWEKEEEEEE